MDFVDLKAADRFPDLLFDLLKRQRVGLRSARLTGKWQETSRRNAFYRQTVTEGFILTQGNFVYFNKPPHKFVFSDYEHGDVYSRLSSKELEKRISCKVGMASSAAIFILEAGLSQEIIITVPLTKKKQR